MPDVWGEQHSETMHSWDHIGYYLVSVVGDGPGMYNILEADP